VVCFMVFGVMTLVRPVDRTNDSDCSCKNDPVLYGLEEERKFLHTIEGRLTGLVTSCVLITS
jgi:hypothetical protein